MLGKLLCHPGNALFYIILIGSSDSAGCVTFVGQHFFFLWLSWHKTKNRLFSRGGTTLLSTIKLESLHHGACTNAGSVVMGVAAVLNGFVPRKLGEISTAPPHSLVLSLLPEYQLG